MVEERRKELQNKDFVEAETGEVRRKKRSRKVIGEEGTRKQTAIGLIVTILLGLFFYLPTEVKNWWEGFNQSETITILKPVGDEKDVSEVVGFKVEIRRKQDAEGVISKMLEDLSGDYGVYVKKVESGEGIEINETKVFSAASVIKLPILAAYYQAVDSQQIDPKEIYELVEKDRWEYGSGSMQNQPVGTKYSYKEVAHLVANQSDNMGTRIMIGWLGGETKIDGVIRKWGLTRTSTREGETTPYEMGELLRMIDEEELLSKESKEELFKNLTNTINEDRITAGVPTGVRVVHKFGSEEGIVNDCGIVYGGSTYVICLLSAEVNDGEAQEVLPKISRVVWEWVGK